MGVQRQYSGTAGKVDNCQLGVFLAYASAKGRAFIDRELYLPERWTDDPERCRAARIPEQVEFRTKPELAQLMLERALDAGVPAAWVTADEVYGGSPALRRLAGGPRPVACAGGQVHRTARGGWATGAGADQRRAAGRGGAGRAVDRLQRRPRRQGPPPVRLDPRRAGHPGYRRHGAGGCWCAAAAATASWPSTPATARPKRSLARAWSGWPGPAGRWRRASEQAKTEVGLDHYEVRRWPGWYRHITLALLAHAFLVVTRAQATSPSAQRGTRRPDQPARPAPAHRARGPPAAGRPGLDLRPSSLASCWPGPRWRRRHQARARRAHYQRREQTRRLEY